MSDTALTEAVAWRKYLLQFSGVYALAIALVSGGSYLLNFDPPSASGLITLMAATTSTAQSFTYREKRLMTKSERSYFAVMATIISLAFAAVFVGGVLLYYGVGPLEVLSGFDIPMSLIPVFLLIAALVSWLVVYFFSGFMAKQAMKQIEKRKTSA